MNITHRRTHVILFQEIAERRVYMQGRGDEETELEFEEELVAGSNVQHFGRQVSKSSIIAIWTIKCLCYRYKHKCCSFYETWQNFFCPAYIEAKEKEVLFCLMNAEQMACCTVGEKGAAAHIVPAVCCS